MGRNIKKYAEYKLKSQKPTYVLIILPLDITSIGNDKENTFFNKNIIEY